MANVWAWPGDDSSRIGAIVPQREYAGAIGWFAIACLRPLNPLIWNAGTFHTAIDCGALLGTGSGHYQRRASSWPGEAGRGSIRPRSALANSFSRYMTNR